MNFDQQRSSSFVNNVLPKVSEYPKVKVMVTPSYLSIHSVVNTQNQQFSVGVQNVHWLESGAFTGEVSPQMAISAGVKFTLLGHSERRQFFGDTDLTVAKRCKSSIMAGLPVIVCLGETSAERNQGKTNEVLEATIRCLAEEISEVNYDGMLCLAYEPVWAIGTGVSASLSEIAQAHRFIIDTLKKLNINSEIKVLYGGSVKPDNFADIINIPEVSGALVGGASLKEGDFVALVSIANLK
jgi:triosephosphate isomerase (TIM)